MEMHSFYQVLDPYLIWFYRLTGNAGWDFVIGTLVLVGLTMLIGEATLFLIFKLIHKRLSAKTTEAEKYNDLAMDALKIGNKEAYQAANKLATEAFGHSFFQQIALSAAFLWPVCFALAWMQYRFLEVEFPLPVIGVSLGYIGIFICLYVAAYLGVKRAKKLLSRRRMEAVSDFDPSRSREPQGLGALAPPVPTPEHK